MDRIHNIFVRDVSDDTLTPAMVNLLIALLVLLLVGLLSLVALFVLRSRRRARRNAEQLPMYSEKEPGSSNHRRLTVTATPYGRHSQSIFVYNDKHAFVDDSTSPPASPGSIPEIRITFPEEEDEAGKRRSGRVVVVRVGETGVGFEPVDDQGLPPYQSSDAQRFQSVDLERVGGLHEKTPEPRRSS